MYVEKVDSVFLKNVYISPRNFWLTKLALITHNFGSHYTELLARETPLILLLKRFFR